MEIQQPVALVTSGPTLEYIDPVRYITNASSGKQGTAIAKELVNRGFRVILVTGPTNEPYPSNVEVIQITSAKEMLEACLRSLPVDVAVCVAAVADFRAKDPKSKKIKKVNMNEEITLKLLRNPDILKTIATHKERPKIVVGFALESEDLIANARKKLKDKNCDIIVANLVSKVEGLNPFGTTNNSVIFVTEFEEIMLKNQTKQIIAEKLVDKICKFL